MNWEDYGKTAVKLCVWREARGEPRDGWRGVAHVIFNRAKNGNRNLATVVYAPLQFSSMTYGRDPQLDSYPKPGDSVFAAIDELVELIASGGDFDLTGGATHYFADTIAPPAWASAMTPTIKIGHHQFFK